MVFLFNLSSAIASLNEAMVNDKEKLSEEDLKVLQLKNTMVGLTGFDLSNVEEQDGIIIISAKLKENQVELKLDGSTLKLVAVKCPTMPVNANTVLDEARTLPPPNDIRQAILLLLASLDSATVFKNHLQQMKKKAIVSQNDSYEASISLQNGVKITVQANIFYPLVSCISLFLIEVLFH